MAIYIKDKLARIGKKQVQLATELGVSTVLVSEWARGLKTPRTERLPALARALDCTVDDLYREGVTQK